MNKKTYSVLWSESAQFDLESIIDYIADESKVNAKKVFEDIKVHCLKFEDFPKIGKIPPELKNISIETYREIVVAPWRILYRVNNDEVLVLAVIDSRRDIDDTLLNRLLNRK